jgi:hypothetical protein
MMKRTLINLNQYTKKIKKKCKIIKLFLKMKLKIIFKLSNKFILFQVKY